MQGPYRYQPEGKVFAVFRVSFREYQDDGLHALSRNVHVYDFPRGILLPTQSFQQGRVVVTQGPSDVVLVFDLSHEILALYDLILQVEVGKFVLALVLAVLGLEDLFGLREGYPILEVKHSVRRVGTVVAEDLAEWDFHPVAHLGDGKIQNSIRFGGLFTAVVLRDELPDVLVGETELLSVVLGLRRTSGFRRYLIHLHALDVHAESVDEKSSEVVQKPRLRVAVGEFERQRQRVRDDALASVQRGDGHGVNVLGSRFGLDGRCDLHAPFPFNRR